MTSGKPSAPCWSGPVSWKSKAGALARWAALASIDIYRKHLSPLKRPSCRFYPSCSEYAYQAVARYGAFRGGLMAAWRILRCHPLTRGGYDPVV